MGLIALEGMEFYAYHGFYEEEQLIGGDYIIDVYLDTDFDAASYNDELDVTINYETIYRIVKVEMQKNSKLLEAIARRIIEKIIGICKTVQAIKIRVTKKHPPLGASVQRAFIELEESYVVQCNKCKRPFLSHHHGDCWTKHGQIYPETRATLTRTFGPNICYNCLLPHFIKARKD
ncbi:dihydroneopterin aldolase [Aureispira anguillae]|uniref:7,8-dihydroneopterin aldolase n=1 Tax=Aureispira anguillae TaxID=2864201 RepID=A0A916DPM3_9BACT|nr:dihydroneopterin aldolase [Aureispira anguillae]BDS10221.1 dihydroneopterin aldolase [Aureispira anguillae]